jgi:CelD/BcsL family acetyltransferase involved in cellulose biosynthesis
MIVMANSQMARIHLTDCFRQGAVLQLAEELFSSGGRGFSPGVRPLNEWALAPEVSFRQALHAATLQAGGDHFPLECS